jgi:ATP-dependent DNA ligase
MAAATVTDLPSGPGWVFEPKFDGFRALAFCDAAGVHLQSRQQRPLTPAFPDVAAALAGLTRRAAVLDGELVVWRSGRFDFPALQDRLRSGRERVRDLAAAAPATYVVFDLLARDGADLRAQPYAARRAALEELLAAGLPPGLVLVPATPDPGVARTWLRGYTGSGIEGVVAKRADQHYRPGVRGWQKLRARVTGEAVVGGVLGRVDAPQVLLLGRFDGAGHLQLAGRTTELAAAARAAVGAVLRPHPGPGHPWPETLPRSRYGRRPAEPLSYTRVQPRTVVELVVDPAVDGPRWRHAARFLRLRPDLHPDDIGPAGRAENGADVAARRAIRPRGPAAGAG